MAELTLSITMLRRFEACDLYKRVADITRAMGRVLHEDDELPLRVWWDLGTTSVSDMWWSLRCLGESGKRIGVEAACLSARRVLPQVREHDRPVCLAAIEAAEGWLRGEVTQMECGKAAAGADAAARAAYMAGTLASTEAAAAAAHATLASTEAAVRAAYAAARAAARAVHAADAAEREQQRIDLYRLALGE